jgi:hypothetical protein
MHGRNEKNIQAHKAENQLGPNCRYEMLGKAWDFLASCDYYLLRTLLYEVELFSTAIG